MQYDNAYENSKFVLMQIMKDHLTTPQGQRLLHAKSMRELWYVTACAFGPVAWGR